MLLLFLLLKRVGGEKYCGGARGGSSQVQIREVLIVKQTKINEGYVETDREQLFSSSH